MKATDRNFASLILEPDWIRQSLQAPLPGNNAHARMSGRAPQTMQIPEGAAQAAVMIAFLDGATDASNDPKMHNGPDRTMGTGMEQSDSAPESQPGPGTEGSATNPGRFPLILRPGNQGPHSGQISLPGGKREPGESLEETALRETEEEIGLDASRIQELGKLTPLYIPVSGFAVHPFVGWFSDAPRFRRDPLEVDEILFYDLLRLSHPDFRTVFDFSYNGTNFQSPGFKLEDRVIWGATAMILMELTEHLLSIANQ